KPVVSCQRRPLAGGRISPCRYLPDRRSALGVNGRSGTSLRDPRTSQTARDRWTAPKISHADSAGSIPVTRAPSPANHVLNSGTVTRSSEDPVGIHPSVINDLVVGT